MEPYQILMIDPPWPQRKGNKRKVRPAQISSLAYKTMPVKEIFLLLDRDIFPLAAKDHCIFLWTIDKFLAESELSMEIRGYKRHCRFIWDKMNGIAPSFTVRFAHEYLIWFYKDRLLPIRTEARGLYTSVFREYRRQHSRKPEFSFALVNDLYPNGKKLDVFSRERRPGWEQYGDQADFFNN